MSAVSQTIDIWSLGCVFSIAATWVVLGYNGIRQFSKVRQKAIDMVLHQLEQQQPVRPLSGLSAGDLFHDGEGVLKDVLSWHNVLRGSLRKTDTITSGVLDLVDTHMLLGDAGLRINAKDLCIKLRDIISRSEAQTRTVLPESIAGALLEADEKAGSLSSLKAKSANAQSLAVSNGRKARKSALMALPLVKTTHRSEGLKSVLASQHARPDEPQAKLKVIVDTSSKGTSGVLRSKIGGVNASSGVSIAGLPSSTGLSSQDAIDRISSQDNKRHTSTTPNSTRPTKKVRIHTPQDVFQAREEYEKRNRGNWLGSERKDNLLSRWFMNRDIVS